MIFPPYADKTETNKIKIKHHNTVFFNTKTWDTHPYASPEGHETTSLGKYQRWSTTRPLGAAMRLTALSQSEDISRHPTTYRHQKPISDLKNYSPSHLPCKCKLISANTGKCGRTGHRCAPYGGAARAPRETAHPSPLLVPPTINTGLYNSRMLPNTTTKKPDPQAAGNAGARY